MTHARVNSTKMDGDSYSDHLYSISTARLGIALLLLGLLQACGGGGGSTDAGGSQPKLGAALPDGDHVLFLTDSVVLSEADRSVNLTVARSGDASGDTSVSYRINEISASRGSDFSAADGVLLWADGDTSTRDITVWVHSDLDAETTEQLSVELFSPTGIETLTKNSLVTIDVSDAVCDGVIASSINTNTTLNKACYRMSTSVNVAGTAQLALNPGTTVIADAGVSLTINGAANIHAGGSRTKPIVLRGANPEKGYWGGIEVNSANPLQQLSHVQLSDAVQGVAFADGASPAAFNDNTIGNTSAVALTFPMAQADLLNNNNRFTNTDGGVVLRPALIDKQDTIEIADHGTHYLISGSVIVNGRLLIKPGVDIKMARDSRILMTRAGVLSAVGTPERPITIRGEQNLQGYWNGIQFMSSGSTDNRLAYARIADGGGDPARAGNIVIEGPGTSLSVAHCELSRSEGYGLVQKAAVASLSLADNTFSENALGDVSVP